MSRMRMKSRGKNRTGTRVSLKHNASNRFGRSRRSNSLRSQAKSIASMIRTLLIPFFILVVLSLGLWIFQTFDPFYSFNPFLKVITVGQTVIGSWHYGGLDGTGNLRFYHDMNGFQTVTVPSNLTRFAADGQFVLLVNHTPVSLMIETRGQYMLQILFQTFTILTVAAVLLLIIAQFTIRKSNRSAFRATKQKR